MVKLVDRQHAENSSFLTVSRTLKKQKMVISKFSAQNCTLTGLMEILITLTVWNFFSQLTVFIDIKSENTGLELKALNFLYSSEGSFPALEIPFNITITIPVTVVIVEWSFGFQKWTALRIIWGQLWHKTGQTDWSSHLSRKKQHPALNIWPITVCAARMEKVRLWVGSPSGRPCHI